ncbi:MAG TPA: hypothetical protein VE265_11330 [Actinomycetota bacterium]|nr:hypothetical protein [Actinomycetota bacterium]
MPRLLLIVVLVVAVAWLGFQAVRAFDQDRHAREAAAVLSAPDTVTHPLAAAPAAPDGRTSPSNPDAGAPEREGNRQPGEALDAVHSPGGRFSHRPGTWLSVVELEGLDQVAGDERYLVFLRNWAGWTLAGAARPGPDGTAQVRSAAEPRPATVYEVVVTRAVDDATSIPHGQPVLQWFDASLGPPRARRFDFALGV